MNRIGKEKNMTVRSGGRTIRTKGNRASWKKAVVTLKEGNSINLLEGDVVE
jgi:large subunit ribosomal protein L23